MPWSIYLWFWICFLSNLLGTYRTEVGEVWEDSEEASEISADPMKRLDDQQPERQVRQKLIREIHADMKTFLQDFPNVARDVNETGRSVLQMRTFIIPFLSDIEEVQQDISVIKRYVVSIYKNLSHHCSDSKPDRMTFHAIKNLTRLSNSSFTRFKNIYSGLRDNYRKLNENYKTVSGNISVMQQSLEFINRLWPLVEASVNASIAKLDHIASTEDEIKQQLINSKYEIRKELAKLERKLEMTLAAIREDTRLINERITQESQEITAKILELKDIIMYHCHLLPGRKGPKFSITNIFEYIPVIKRVSVVFKKLKKLKPIVAIGGTVGVGHLFGNFNNSINPTGLVGTIGGLIIFPNVSFDILGDIASLFPTPAETPRPTAPPKPHPWPFPFPDFPPFGDLIPGLSPEPDEEEPTRPPRPTRPPGEPARPPGIPTRPPGEPARPPLPPPRPPLPTESPGLPGRPAEPSHPDVLPPSIPTPIPRPPEPVPLRPLVPLDIDGLDDYCACRCSCPCNCPILPVPARKNHWWLHLPIFDDENMQCDCLCACPCPLERRPIVKREAPDFYRDVAMLDNEIRFLQKDLTDLKTSITDRLIMTEAAIIGEMNSRFLEVTSALAAIQKSNELLHEEVAVVSGGIKEIMEGEIIRIIYPKVHTINMALGDLKHADQILRDDIRHTAHSFKATIQKLYSSEHGRRKRSEEGNSKISRNDRESLSNVSFTESPFSIAEITP